MTKTERPRFGCKCRCDGYTYSTYMPGHDARHLTAVVEEFVSRRRSGRGHSLEIYRSCVERFKTAAMRRKFRARALSAIAFRGAAEMTDAEWQRTMRLDALVREWDAEGAADYNGSVSDIAAFAALIGWTRQSVNRRRS